MPSGFNLYSHRKFAIVLLFLVMVILAPLLAPYDHAAQDLERRLESPSRFHWLGTDHLGRDLLSRIITGSRIALSAAVPAVLISLAGGLLLGLTGGYLGGTVAAAAVVLIDSIQAFPALVLAMAILALFGPSLANEILVIGIAWIPGYARVARAQVMSARSTWSVGIGPFAGRSARVSPSRSSMTM